MSFYSRKEHSFDRAHRRRINRASESYRRLISDTASPVEKQKDIPAPTRRVRPQQRRITADWYEIGVEFLGLSEKEAKDIFS